MYMLMGTGERKDSRAAKYFIGDGKEGEWRAAFYCMKRAGRAAVRGLL